MNHNRKEWLFEYFKAPEPEKKRDFVRRYSYNRMSIPHMLGVQCRYISKGTWFGSVGIFALGIVLNYIGSGKSGLYLLRTPAPEGDVSLWQYTGMVYALIPFLTMLSLTESMRSYRYGMDELEAAARFSLKSIIFMRMLILGLGNLLLLVLLALSGRNFFWQEIVFLMVPYLLTSSGGLAIIKRFPGREGNYLCFTLSLMVGAMELLLTERYSYIYDVQYMGLWLLALFGCQCFLILEGRRVMQPVEV